MDSLHSDLLFLVVLDLPLSALAACRLVSRRWCHLLTSEKFCHGYYWQHAPHGMRLETPPAGMKWWDVHAKLPLLCRAEPALRECCRRWPQLVVDQQTHVFDGFPIELWDGKLENDPPHIGLSPLLADPGMVYLDRHIDCYTSQTLRFHDRDLHSLLFYLLLDGGRSLGVEIPLGSYGPLTRLCVSTMVDPIEYELL